MSPIAIDVGYWNRGGGVPFTLPCPSILVKEDDLDPEALALE